MVESEVHSRDGNHGVGSSIAWSVRRLIPAVAIGALVMACGDFTGMAGQAHRFIDGAVDVLALGLMVTGVYVWTGLWVAVFCGLLLALVSRGRPGEMIARAGAGLLSLFRSKDTRIGSRLVAGLFCTAGYFAIMTLSVSRIAEKVNSPTLAGLSAAGIAIGAAAGLLVAWWVLSTVLELAGRLPVFRRLLASRTVAIVFIVLAAAGFAAAVVFERRIFKSLDGWRIYLPALGAMAAILVALFQPARHLVGNVRTRRILTASVASVLAVATAFGLLWAGMYDAPRALFLSFGRNGAQAAGAWAVVFDVDRDGASTFMGGYDCQPWNSAIYPGAPDVPDNKVDEDCQDGDLKAKLQDVREAALTNPWKAVKKPDVLVISIDGCRRDAIGAYGAKASRTPELDRLAADSIVFDDAMAPASWTTPAFAAILTGRYAGEIPGYYGLSRTKAVPSSMPLLFKPFARAGYRTVAVTAGLQLDKLGLDRDLDDWFMVSKGPRGRLAGPTADRAVSVLTGAKKDKPLFLWVHFIDPHFPYDPPKNHQLFGKDARGRYAGEIHYADEALGRVMKALKESGREDNTIVVVFSDHGEAFLEHGREFHGESVYTEEVRVPMMIRLPGGTPARIPNLVSTLDIGPTLWDLIGTKRSQPTRGVSLAPLIVNGKAPSRQYVFSEQTRKTREFALTSAEYRLRYDRTLNRYELFDRKTDPDEQSDVAGSRIQILRKMRVELTRNMSAIDAVANRKVGDVLLKKIPKGYVSVEDQFSGGPGLEAYKLTRKGRKITFSVVLKSRGPINDVEAVNVVLTVRDKSGVSFWSNTQEVTGGAYSASRWRSGDLVRHRGDFNLKNNPPVGAQICMSLAGDDTPFEMVSGEFERCFRLP